MSEDRLQAWVEAKEPLEVRRFSIFEALNRPFEVSLLLRSPNVAIDLDAIVNRPASFRMDSGGRAAKEPRRLWTGFCNHFEQLRPEREHGGIKARSSYWMRIVPKLWQLHLRQDHRHFRHQSVVDIVNAVLGPWKIKPDWRLNKGKDYYKKLEYVVQYGETDFAFFSRLLEAAGIGYFFLHAGDADTALVLSDEPEHGSARSPLDFVDVPPESGEIEMVTNVRLAHRVKPGKVSIRDYDFHQQADFALLAEGVTGQQDEASFEHYRYAPGAFRVLDRGSDVLADERGKWPYRHTLAEGKERAERELNSLRYGKRSVCFESNCVGLHPGRVFSLDGHARDDLSSKNKLLLTEYQLDGEPRGRWLFAGEAVFADVPCQPPLTTPKPRIAGLQSAFVVGPASADDKEIYPDEYGRVRVQFQWDRLSKSDENSSCWLRVSQPWAGSGFGAMFLPRVGNEVLVSYFDGDPDMPVVVGRSYNTTRPLPYTLPDHSTKSVVKSKTSPQSDEGGAFNELRFEDQKGDELIYMQAQKDFQQLVKRSETERTGKTRVAVVGNHRCSVVAKVDARLVGEKYSLQIVEQPDKGKDEVEDKQQLKILEQRAPELTPLPTKIEMIDKRIMATSAQASVVMDHKEITFNAEGELSLEAGGTIVIFGGSKIKINC